MSAAAFSRYLVRRTVCSDVHCSAACLGAARCRMACVPKELTRCRKRVAVLLAALRRGNGHAETPKQGGVHSWQCEHVPCALTTYRQQQVGRDAGVSQSVLHGESSPLRKRNDPCTSRWLKAWLKGHQSSCKKLDLSWTEKYNAYAGVYRNVNSVS